MKRVLLVGASGMLGSSLAPYLRSAGYEVIRQSRGYGYDIRFNPSDHLAWVACLTQLRLDTIINLAAATNVDQCECNPQWAFDANVGPLLALQRAFSLIGKSTHTVHISTDQVYDGIGPHTEHNERPCNVYGLSKLSAELAISGHNATIFRTNFFGLSHAKGRASFTDWIVKSIKAGRQITLFDDVYFSAIHMQTLCEFINMAIVNKPLGIFNVGSSDGISKADFALQLAKLMRLDTGSLHVGSVKQLDLSAMRPLDMRLDTTRFCQVFAVKCPSIAAELQKAAHEYYDCS